MDCANAQYPPITKELRDSFTTAHIDASTGLSTLLLESKAFYDRCDTIDAVHARLEAAYDRLRAEYASMAAALDSADGEHDYAPESHYVMLPKDADGVPWHIGDVTENGNVVHEMLLNKNGWIFMGQNDIDPSIHHHHNPDTWEHIIEDALDGYHDTDFDKLVARCKALAGDAE